MATRVPQSPGERSLQGYFPTDMYAGQEGGQRNQWHHFRGADRQTDGKAHHPSQSPSQPPLPTQLEVLQWRDRKGKDPAELPVSASL